MDQERITVDPNRMRGLPSIRDTRVTVKLQYDPLGGRLGALVALLFGREPSQTIREDLRRLKQLLEAGELPVAISAGDLPVAISLNGRTER